MSKRFTLIDGYNVLHVNGLLRSNVVGPGELENARNQLLNLLARQLDQPRRSRTTIVFDSQYPQLPQRWTSHDMLVEFAAEFQNADELIAILIRRHSAPKQLLVVSSDHEIQKVAKARGALTMDSDAWLDSLDDNAAGRHVGKATPSEEPKPSGERIDVAFWKAELGVEAMSEELLQDPTPENPCGQRLPGPAANPEISESIFPPGYADDLFEDD